MHLIKYEDDDEIWQNIREDLKKNFLRWLPGGGAGKRACTVPI